MEKKISTKYKILIESLRLFSERGFDSVTVAEIASRLGISAPALYKHYKNKQEIFDAIIDYSTECYKEEMNRLHVDFEDEEEIKEKYINITDSELEEMVRALFIHAVHNEFVCMFRKLLTVEQFNRPKLAEIYNQRYVDFQYSHFENLFRVLVEAKKFKEEDPILLAMNLIAPVIVGIGVCDRDPSKEKKVLETICSHVKLFNKTFRINF